MLSCQLVQSLPRKGQDFVAERSGLVREELDPDGLGIASLEAEVRERERCPRVDQLQSQWIRRPGGFRPHLGLFVVMGTKRNHGS
jgi:hypothetical protein